MVMHLQGEDLFGGLPVLRHFVGSEPVRLYLDSGELQFIVRRTGTYIGSATANFAVSGYLVDH